MWYRVFSLAETEVPPSALLEHLHGQGLTVAGHFRGDDLGWTAGELVLPDEARVALTRYLADEDDIRDDLNSWAAWLETADYSPNAAPLMEHMIRTAQLVTLRKPVGASDEITLERVCLEVCRFLAGRTRGVYQIDGQGFFAADGALLVQEY